jgi:hypothetical protein
MVVVQLEVVITIIGKSGRQWSLDSVIFVLAEVSDSDGEEAMTVIEAMVIRQVMV